MSDRSGLRSGKSHTPTNSTSWPTIRKLSCRGVPAESIATLHEAHIEPDWILIYRIDGDDLGLLVGPKGATLHAIEELVRTVVQRQTDGHGVRIHVDVAGYRAKRREALADFTRSLAEKVIEQTLITILSGGHGLLVGVPGLAKTKLVDTMGTVLGLDARLILGGQVVAVELVRRVRHLDAAVRSGERSAVEVTEQHPPRRRAIGTCQQSQQVLLPLPERPMTATNEPAPMTRSMPRRKAILSASAARGAAATTALNHCHRIFIALSATVGTGSHGEAGTGSNAVTAW